MLSLKRSMVLLALISSSQGGFKNPFKSQSVGEAPISQEIPQDNNAPYKDEYGVGVVHDSRMTDRESLDRASILQNEQADPLKAMREQFTKFKKTTYIPKEQPASGKKGKLVIEDYMKQLTAEASLLNQEFLANSEFQFAEYIGLTMIQRVFDNSLQSEDFVQLFESDTPYQQALNENLVQTYQLVQEKIRLFSEKHQEQESEMLKDLLADFKATLLEKEKKNGGFPDTEAMRTALFGQLAFQYEQKIQDIYKDLSDSMIEETGTKIDELLAKNAKKEKDGQQDTAGSSNQGAPVDPPFLAN